MMEFLVLDCAQQVPENFKGLADLVEPFFLWAGGEDYVLSF